MSVLSFLKKSDPIELGGLITDIHSHLIPGIDDGAQTMDESIDLIKGLKNLGFRQLITTPHIMQDHFPNTPEIIRNGLYELRIELQKENIDVRIDAAAEYYLDEFLMEKLANKEDLLFIQEKYILFEMSFMTESPFLKEFIFQLRSLGKTPILAHAERYSYYFGNIHEIEDIHERGALIQMNLNSLSGYYGKDVKKLAEQLIDRGMVHLVGSDCHHTDHLIRLNQIRQMKYAKKALNLPLLNREISL